MSLRKLNYIGSKHSLLSFIQETIQNEVSVNIVGKKFVDVFSGTSSVGFHFRNLGCKVISNDLEYYSYVIAKASICSNYTDKLKGLIDEFNLLDPVKGLITRNYSEDGEDKRMFFAVKNAMKIDAMRLRLEDIRNVLSEEEYYFLLGSIIVSADSIANVPAIYGSYLKDYKKTAMKDMLLEPIHMERELLKGKVYNRECLELVDEIGKVDWVYLDPPYNERQYGKNYHVLNYIARYDEDMEIYGKTGLIKDTILSDWCSRGKAKIVLDRLLDKLKTKTDYIFMSYNNEGIIGHDEIEEIFSKYCETKIVSKEYRRFKNFNYNESGPTFEYIWVGKVKN